MKANELRIGNYVKADGYYPYAEIDGIEKEMVRINHESFSYEAISPVTITKSIIKDNNLNYLEIHDSKFSGILKVVYTPSLKKCCVWIGYTEISIIEFVHELQNLYFALTGNELQLHH